ncbi:hypothetical protein GCM10027059_45210 [Myceligenerans halotolerans]
MEPDHARTRLAEAIRVFHDDVRPATRETLIAAAVDALVAGLDSPALAELAGRYPDDPWSELGQTADAVVHELDLQLPTMPQVATAQLRRKLEALLAGNLSPRELTRWAHSEFGHDELDAAQPFVEADDEYDILEHTGRASDEVDSWVRDQAVAALDRPPDVQNEAASLPLTVLRNGTTETWNLTVTENDRDHVLRLTAPDGQSWQVEDFDAWHALRALRAVVEPAGVQMCCQGARIDARVSGMSGSMSGGRLAYLLRAWRNPRTRDLVDIFAPAPLNKVGTLAEQDAFYERWLERWWTRLW